MKAVMGDLKGKADGKLINQVVAEYLQIKHVHKVRSGNRL